MKKNDKTNKKIIQGRWWKINSKIQESIPAKYDRIIKIDKEFKLIRVAYCEIVKSVKNPIHNMKVEITGTTAIEIVNTLINKGYVSTLQHAADMGIELHKAQLALKYKLEYIQDKEIII